jgi:anthranilate synthase/aminodeoxychorismate synthase-like glutamine amidotransferase
MILLLDNYDSFVYNLARYLRELGETVEVRRNDRVTVEEARELAPTHLVVSPGPCTPSEAGVSNRLVRELGADVPVLGVCLGHQCIGVSHGGRVVRASRPMHGKTSRIHHGGDGLFAGIPSPFPGTRYHSLVVERESLPGELEVIAWTGEGEVMALRHRRRPVWGVQFHPEAILTRGGHALLANFLALGRGRDPAEEAPPTPAGELADAEMGTGPSAGPASGATDPGELAPRA